MDNKYNTLGRNRDRINISEYYEVEYWAKKFGIRPDELKIAVNAAGTSPAEVEKYLK